MSSDDSVSPFASGNPCHLLLLMTFLGARRRRRNKQRRKEIQQDSVPHRPLSRAGASRLAGHSRVPTVRAGLPCILWAFQNPHRKGSETLSDLPQLPQSGLNLNLSL